MNGARFIHDELVKCAWEVLVADAPRSRGWRRWRARPKDDARVLAELSFRDLVPAIWPVSRPARRARAVSLAAGTPVFLSLR
jgi:hypothetical protein